MATGVRETAGPMTVSQVLEWLRAREREWEEGEMSRHLGEWGDQPFYLLGPSGGVCRVHRLEMTELGFVFFTDDQPPSPGALTESQC